MEVGKIHLPKVGNFRLPLTPATNLGQFVQPPEL